MIEIDFINGRRTDQVFGTSKYTNEIYNRIQGVHLNKIEYPQIGSSRFIDGSLKRILYPILVKHGIGYSSIKHITHQDLAFLLCYLDLHPSIVTCYDLIPIAYYKNQSIHWKMNLRGLRKADHIITISEFSKMEIMRLAGIPADKISVIYPGVDPAYYFPKRDRSILSQYAIDNNDYVLMYLGSEEPRKNIILILKSLMDLKKTFPNIKLLKVGSAQMGGDRQSLINLIKSMHLENEVIFTGQVTESDLPKYYNAADIFLFPSLYEGFGLPPLEAMACGCPVIVADATSLPEVIGDAGILIDPDGSHNLTTQMNELLSDENKRTILIKRGLQRANLFSWDDSAKKTMDIYKNIST